MEEDWPISPNQTIGFILLGLPLGWFYVLLGQDEWALAAAILPFYTCKFLASGLLQRKPELNLPICILGICLTGLGSVVAQWEPNQNQSGLLTIT